ncbi:MAG: FecCD family ABC transporter permease [Mycobacteriaceae bacterium]
MTQKLRAIRIGNVSLALQPNSILIATILMVLLLGLCLIDLARGEYSLSISQIFDVLRGRGTRAQRIIILETRLPSVVLGVLVGAALGLAGAITQAVLCNPLAGPDLLGITGGAAVAALSVIILDATALFGSFATLGVAGAALIGGLLAGTTIFALAWSNGLDGFRLILVGIGINAMAMALLSWLLVYADLNEATRAQLWLNGSLDSRQWAELLPLLVGFILVLSFILLSTPVITVLRFGNDKARSLGVNVPVYQAVFLILAVILASLSTSLTGPIGFIALAAPQIARQLKESVIEPPLFSALIGAILVVGADIVARTLLPITLPIGIVTSAVGGFFLLFLLIVLHRKASA